MPTLRSTAQRQHPASRISLPPPRRTIGDLLRERAEADPDRMLVATEGVSLTAGQLREAAARTGQALLDAGVAPGDRVALLAENSAEFLQTLLGCAWIGAIAVPLNTSLRGPALAHQLADSGATLLVVDPGLCFVLETIDLPDALSRVHLISAPGAAGDQERQGPAYAGGPLVAAAHEAPLHPTTPGTPALILYTSGTTGPAKGVVCPHAQFYWWGVNGADQMQVGPEDVLYTCLPLFHVNALGTFFQSLITGARLVVGPRFSASRMFARLAAAEATVTYLLGVMVSILEARPPGPEDRAHAVTRALAPGVSEAQVRLWRERFRIELVDGYGSTETNAVIGALPGSQRGGSMGRIRPGFTARVVDEHDHELPPGTPGELVIRGDEPWSLASGYFGAAAQTTQAWRNLWLHTGDLVTCSEDGWFYFRDRLKDSIRRRGENISSHDVEAAILTHPAVEQVAAYALPSELGEDEVAVAVVCGEPAPTPEELVRWCEGRLAYFAIPRFVRSLPELPLTENGKVRKSVLREEGSVACWDREAAGVVVARDR